MKSTLTSLSVLLLVLVVSCKKDKDSGIDGLSGDYNVYRMVVEDPQDGPIVYPVPTPDGNTSKVVVKVNKDSSMSANCFVFNNKKDTLSRVALTGRVTKIGNGDLRFVNGAKWQGTFVQGNELEIYPDATSTLYGKK